MRPMDTSPEAFAVHNETLSRLGGAERFRMAWELSELLRGHVFGRIRKQHPDYSQKQIVDAYLREVRIQTGLQRATK